MGLRPATLNDATCVRPEWESGNAWVRPPCRAAANFWATTSPVSALIPFTWRHQDCKMWQPFSGFEHAQGVLLTATASKHRHAWISRSRGRTTSFGVPQRSATHQGGRNLGHCKQRPQHFEFQASIREPLLTRATMHALGEKPKNAPLGFERFLLGEWTTKTSPEAEARLHP